MFYIGDDVTVLIDHGLGYGVDATESTPRKNRSSSVREVIPGEAKNFVQRLETEREYDEWKTYSKKSFEIDIVAAITPSPTPVKIFGRGSFERSTSKRKAIKGKSKIGIFATVYGGEGGVALVAVPY